MNYLPKIQPTVTADMHVDATEIFIKYCQMGSSRSLRRLAKQDDVTYGLSMLLKWSGEFRWVERAAEYDETVRILVMREAVKRQSDAMSAFGVFDADILTLAQSKVLQALEITSDPKEIAQLVLAYRNVRQMFVDLATDHEALLAIMEGIEIEGYNDVDIDSQASLALAESDVESDSEEVMDE